MHIIIPIMIVMYICSCLYDVYMTFDRYTIESFHVKSHKFGGNPVFLAISNGVKQGGILSAILFTVYIDTC